VAASQAAFVHLGGMGMGQEVHQVPSVGSRA
jgi:hypothetical protein